MTEAPMVEETFAKTTTLTHPRPPGSSRNKKQLVKNSEEKFYPAAGERERNVYDRHHS
jgi:hypothetical protein